MPRSPSRSARKRMVGACGSAWGELLGALFHPNIRREIEPIRPFLDLQPDPRQGQERAPQVLGRGIEIPDGLVALAVRPEEVGELVAQKAGRVRGQAGA